jgi:hypothetical protein
MEKLGFWSVGVLPPLGGFSCQVCLQHLSKIFALWSPHYLLPPSSHHPGTSPQEIFYDNFIAGIVISY